MQDAGQFTFSEDKNNPFASQNKPIGRQQERLQTIGDGYDSPFDGHVSLQNDAQLLNQIEVRYPFSRGQQQ